MKFKILSDHLYAHLSHINKVVPSRSPIPIQETVLFEMKDTTIQLTGTDGQLRLVTRLQALEVEEGSEPICVAINMQKLLTPLKTVLSQEVTISIDPTNWKVQMKYINGEFNFVAQSGENFPMPKKTEGDPYLIEMTQQALYNGLSYTHEVASAEGIPVTSGVHFDISPERINFVSTDSYLLAKYSNNHTQLGISTKFTITKKACTLLRHLLDKDSDAHVSLNVYSNRVEISTDKIHLACSLVEGNFPNYERVIPQSNPNEIIVDRISLITAIRRVGLFINPAYGFIRFEIASDHMYLRGLDPDYASEAEEMVPISYIGIAPINIAFKYENLEIALKNMESEQVSIRLSDKAGAAIVSPMDIPKGESALYLLMPMHA